MKGGAGDPGAGNNTSPGNDDGRDVSARTQEATTFAAMRKASVASYAGAFADGKAPAAELLPEHSVDDEGEGESAETILSRSGVELIRSLIGRAQDLLGRTVSKNNEDSSVIKQGLELLTEVGGGRGRVTAAATRRCRHMSWIFFSFPPPQKNLI